MPEHTKQPTNFDLHQEFTAHAKDEATFKEETKRFNGEMAIFKAETEGKLSKLDSMPTTDEISDIVVTAIEGYFRQKGKKAYAGLLILAGIVGALAIIGGGFKAMLGWIGFSYLGK